MHRFNQIDKCALIPIKKIAYIDRLIKNTLIPITILTLKPEQIFHPLHVLTRNFLTFHLRHQL